MRKKVKRLKIVHSNAEGLFNTPRTSRRQSNDPSKLITTKQSSNDLKRYSQGQSRKLESRNVGAFNTLVTQRCFLKIISSFNELNLKINRQIVPGFPVGRYFKSPIWYGRRSTVIIEIPLPSLPSPSRTSNSWIANNSIWHVRYQTEEIIEWNWFSLRL